MIELQLLIDYWKDRQRPYPQITAFKWDVVLRSTIHYLEQLERNKEVSK